MKMYTQLLLKSIIANDEHGIFNRHSLTLPSPAPIKFITSGPQTRPSTVFFQPPMKGSVDIVLEFLHYWATHGGKPVRHYLKINIINNIRDVLTV